MKMLEMQNGFIKDFVTSNNIQEHLKIFAVCPIRNNPETFQIFANVSRMQREVLNEFSNNLTLGLQNCKIYGRYVVKQCTNCQHFEHYKRDCPTAEEHVVDDVVMITKPKNICKLLLRDALTVYGKILMT